MNKNTAMVLFTLGFLMTFGGVGSIELSTDDLALATGVLISGLGLLVMWCGTLGLKVADRY